MLKLSSLLVMLFLSFSTVFSQVSPTVNQSIEWAAISSTMKVHKKVGLYVEGQFRFAQNFQPMQHQFRTAVEIYPSKKFAVVPFGYVYTWNYLYGKQPASVVNNEHRLYQQIVYHHRLSKLVVQHRLRMEERFIQDHFIASDGTMAGSRYDDVRYRLRYRLLANLPLNNPNMEPKTWYISMWDEVFVSWGKPVTYHEPDQNRIFVGLGYQFTKLVSLQAGPLYQVIVKSNGAKQENNYGGMIQLTYNLDFTNPDK